MRLIPKAPRTRLSEEALVKLRSTIHDKPNAESATTKKNNISKVRNPSMSIKPAAVTNVSQPLVLATASDWVIPGNFMGSAIYDAKKDRSQVELLAPESIKPFTYRLIKEDPIDVFDDSDDEKLTCDEKLDEKGSEKDYEVFSVDGMEMVAKTSDFDADALFVDAMANNDTESLNKKSKKQQVLKKEKVGLNVN